MLTGIRCVAMVVVVVWLADGRPTALDHVYSPNIACNTILDNENFDKKDRPMLDKMHMVHSRAEMDQYQAREQTALIININIYRLMTNKCMTDQFMKTIAFNIDGTSSNGTHITM
jgi:hypothetical protein